MDPPFLASRKTGAAEHAPGPSISCISASPLVSRVILSVSYPANATRAISGVIVKRGRLMFPFPLYRTTRCLLGVSSHCLF